MPDLSGAVRLQRLPLSAVERATYNPRVQLTPTDPEWQAIEASLGEFGLAEPLVYNERTGRLVGGHQRLNILEHNGVVEADFSVVDLDDERERALNLALNKAQGRWDDRALAQMVAGLRESPLLGATGFRGEEVSSLMRRFRGDQAAGFLDDILRPPAPAPGAAPPATAPAPAGGAAQAPEPPPGGVVSTPQAAQGPGATYFNLSFAVTAEQRDVISRGLAAWKEELGLTTTVDVLMARVRAPEA